MNLHGKKGQKFKKVIAISIIIAMIGISGGGTVVYLIQDYKYRQELAKRNESSEYGPQVMDGYQGISGDRTLTQEEINAILRGEPINLSDEETSSP